MQITKRHKNFKIKDLKKLSVSIFNALSPLFKTKTQNITSHIFPII